MAVINPYTFIGKPQPRPAPSLPSAKKGRGYDKFRPATIGTLSERLVAGSQWLRDGSVATVDYLTVLRRTVGPFTANGTRPAPVQETVNDVPADSDPETVLVSYTDADGTRHDYTLLSTFRGRYPHYVQPHTRKVVAEPAPEPVVEPVRVNAVSLGSFV